ncbi:TIGR03084 family metal-binding protein [Streptomyces sp. NBC_01497]|uniref:TIGR03084 family metal-binding protein n=1 Tax=Streptomyces sp. NBC_01497 TaxID=2903885 RepID=UPI002E36C043|nr:TIGR03084 family metal-binding protein [Streptomyces sp. NBC_01497]
MAVSMSVLATDLTAETEDLRALLVPLGEEDWQRPTPSPGWTILDQVTHLAHYDREAVRAVLEPDDFTAEKRRIGFVDPDVHAARHRDLGGAQALAWFAETRARLLSVYLGLDPKRRVPWFGPSLSAASALTARIMETWAHGQDIADALGVTRTPTARLRHVAHIGVATRPYSYLVHGKQDPEAPVRVRLTAPDGDEWSWGPEDALDRVEGTALDFCLVVTQRRHPDDTGLRTTGPGAAEWLTLAQAFGGPAGMGRPPRER